MQAERGATCWQGRLDGPGWQGRRGSTPTGGALIWPVSGRRPGGGNAPWLDPNGGESGPPGPEPGEMAPADGRPAQAVPGNATGLGGAPAFWSRVTTPQIRTPARQPWGRAVGARTVQDGVPHGGAAPVYGAAGYAGVVRVSARAGCGTFLSAGGDQGNGATICHGGAASMPCRGNGGQRPAWAQNWWVQDSARMAPAPCQGRGCGAGRGRRALPMGAGPQGQTRAQSGFTGATHAATRACPLAIGG